MPKHIASGLKYLAAVKLKNQGKSQQFIADELKVDRSTVSHYFNGRNLSWNSIDVARTITELTPLPDQCRKIVNICKNKEYNAIIEDTCIGCGLCVSLCFMNAVSLVALKSQIDSINCCGCLSCKDGCPTNSIKILEI